MESAIVKLSSLFELAEKFNSFYLSGIKKGECRPFIIEGNQVGLIRPDILKKLLGYPEVFLNQPDCVELNPAFRDYNERSSRVDKVLREFRDKNAFLTLKGWRDECYEVRGTYSDVPLLKMERSAMCLFGIRKYGVDINGYVKHPEKGLCLWLQRRAPTKQTWPGKWDNMADHNPATPIGLHLDHPFSFFTTYFSTPHPRVLVSENEVWTMQVSGGLSIGYGITETAKKEAYEEASVPIDILNNLKAAGSVSFFYESERGLHPNTEFVFDLELPLDFLPTNNDGEVDKFELLPAEFAIKRVLTSEFKVTSAPVMMDFLVRHGWITPEKEPYFPQLVELLHVPLQSLYKRPRATENGNPS